MTVYFVALFFGTLIQEISLVGFESAPKDERDTYLVVLSIGRSLGILVLCSLYYLLENWLYFNAIVLGLFIFFLGLFMKLVYESPHYILSTSANIDYCKYIINSIASINNESAIEEKIYFSH